MLEAIGALAGSVASGLFGRSQQKANLKAQREFAQHGIRWKVEDAKAAGLHPLAALGAQTHSFSPTVVGDSFAQAGQSIGRAIDSTRTHDERKDANGVLGKLAVERAGLENDLLRSQIAKNNQAGQPPARPAIDERYMGVDGQGSAAKLIESKPMEQTPTDPKRLGQEPGSVVDVGWAKNPNGKWYPLPSKDFNDRSEDNKLVQWMWSARNFWPGSSPPFDAPPGKYWTGNRVTGYRLKPGGLQGLRSHYRRR